MTLTRLRFLILTQLLVSSRLTVQAEDSTPDKFRERIGPVLKTLCFDCHGPNKQQGDIRLDRLNPDLVSGPDAETWHDVLNQLNQGEMPPKKAKQPTPEQRTLLTGWLQSALRKAAAARRFDRGRVKLRRLTRYEYANTMRDLLGLDMDYERDLPPEPTSQEGFLNNASTLEMSPTQIETYLDIARLALSQAIVSNERPTLHSFAQQVTSEGKLPTKKVAGHQPVRPEFILDLKQFPRKGAFELKVTARACIPNGQGLPRVKITMGHVPGIIHVPRGVIGEADVSEESQTFVFRGRMEDFPQPGPIAFGNSGFKGMIVMIDFVDADSRELRYDDRKYAQAAARPKQRAKKAKEEEKQDKPEPKPFGSRLDIEVTSVEFQAPVYQQWPPESHQRILFPSKNSDDEPTYVREVAQRFMSAAFRRPVRSDEVEQTVRLFNAVRDESTSFEEAMREVLASVLVSPHFLYIVESTADQPGSSRVSEYELASRLSYFLWSTRPDDRLLNLAAEGRISDPATLKAEVTRLLEDERSSEFTSRFVDQWLDLGALDRVAVNPEFFPNFDNALKQQMRSESHACFAEILHNDRSALELLESDWTMLNRPLAKHYGIDGPRSSRFERVTLPADDPRGGLLGQGAFLLANSNGEDSHPIKRAVWILDRLLDSPPGSPPADVPDLDAESPDMAKLSLKEQLAIHRSKESCAACHRGIDPWGIPLENFDATGRWRTEVLRHGKRPQVAVAASSELPDGTTISGVRELKKYLMAERREWFAKALVRRLMAYGLGRSLDIGDSQNVDHLTASFTANHFRLKQLIVDFVQSESFLTK